ncbi:MAG: HDOD domain-containing protein [Anaerolineae bacterium]|nr:HDOD domain-containing protein [Anaerolineae bacterium]
MAELLIGRQPIFNRKLDVVAYELLYRSVSQPNQAEFRDGDHATTRVILNTFSEIGLDNIVGQGKAYINATRNFLLGKYPIPLPANRVVLEVLEDIPIDQELIDALQNLSKAGYWIALDDVVSLQEVGPLLRLAKIVKIDLAAVDRDFLYDMVVYLKKLNILLLAEKVETQQEYDYCYRLGFDFFQGYFLCKPSIVKGRRLDASKLVALRSLSKLQDPQATFQELEAIISMDVALGYKLLKLVNSGYYSLSTTVKSIRQAISFIGVNQLRAWMTLLLMTSVENKPNELTTIALQRAKLCEMFARATKRSQVETYFLVGLLSVLDALMDMPMDRVLGNIPVSPEVADALIAHKGEYGEILDAVMAYEQGNWENVLELKINSNELRDIYFEAIHWVNVISKEMYASMEGV